MLITYIGSFDAVEFEIADKTWVEVVRGESIEVPEPLALSLLEQETNWVENSQAKKSAMADPNTVVSQED